MPTEHTRYSYKYDELTDEAKAKAVEEVANRFAGPWWDEHDNAAIREVLVYSFAEQLKTAGWDTYGPGDFPGIDSVSVVGFQVGYAPYVSFNGTLTRENAPGLPWHDHADTIELSGGQRDDTTRVHVAQVEALPFECTACGQSADVTYAYDGTAYTAHVRREDGLVYPDEETDADHDAWLLEGLPTYDNAALARLAEAVEEAVRAALTAGEKEYDYKTGAEYAKEWIEANEPDFNEDGTIF